MRFRSTLPSPSMAVAMTALFVALGGTGYAATQLPGTGDVQSAAKKHKKPTTDTGPDTSLFTKLFAKANDSSQDLAGLNAYLGVTAVPNAKHASAADSATTATNATSAANATHATNADHATSADSAPFVTTLPSGQTLRGAWDLLYAANAVFTQSGESFAFALASAPTQHVIPSGGPNPDPTHCPGTAGDPQAASGHFCLYVTNGSNLGTPSVCDPTQDLCGVNPSRFGFFLQAFPTSASSSGHMTGTWAATG